MDTDRISEHPRADRPGRSPGGVEPDSPIASTEPLCAPGNGG